MKQRFKKKEIFWEYGSEIIFITLAYVAVLFFLGQHRHKLAYFLIDASGLLLSRYITIMLASTIGYFWKFYSQADSEFAKWLFYNQSFFAYRNGFLFAIALFFITTFSFIIINITQNLLAVYIGGWFLTLSVINVYTFFKNIVGLINLNIFFNIEVEKQKCNRKCDVV